MGRAVQVALPVAPNGLVSAASGPGEAQWSWLRTQNAGFEGGCRDDIWARVVGFPIPRKFLAENPEKFDAREWLKPAREAAKAICKQRYIEFGCEGQGAKIKGDNLQVVAAKYTKGELAQVVQ